LEEVKMKLRRRVGLLVLMTAVSLSLAAATNPLNPLVTRTPQTGVVPAECAEGVAPAPAPRIEVREIPLPPPAETATMAEPPTGSLRAALEATQTALTRNDRPAFNASLATARTLLETYPAGAQRRSAEELVRIYNTTARLWDAQYESPFFDDASDAYALLRAYPGYEEAVRRSTLTRDGRRYFPAGESRDFLGRLASDRLRGIGIQAPAPRIARNERPGVPDTPRATASSSTPRPTVTRGSTGTARPRRTTTTTTPSRVTRQPRSAAPSRPRLTETRTAAAATPATSTPAPTPTPSAPAPATTAATPDTAPPIAGTPTTDAPVPTDTDTEPIEPTDTAGVTDTPDPVTPEATGTAGTTATAAPATPESQPSQPARGRSVVLPTILILIGLGVLILLFRASK
jgi:hypothetical protein